VGYVFLKRRTDPSAVRGEKVFMESCLSCHAGGMGPTVQQIIPGIRKREHRFMAGYQRLTEKDQLSLENYLDAFVSENPKITAVK
jgi:cytochrome c